MARALEIVNRFYDATNNRRADELPALVTDDVTFVGPAMQATGAREYVGMNEQLLGFHQGTRMLRQFEDGDDVCSVYELRMTTPAGGSLTLRVADWITVRGDRIAEQHLYFDPREFAQAFGM
jgi:ketosteroid isomerase-like protein